MADLLVPYSFVLLAEFCFQEDPVGTLANGPSPEIRIQEEN